MIDLKQVRIQKIFTHFVGNRSREEGIRLSDAETSLEQETAEYFLSYALDAFKAEEFYHFSHSVELSMNELYKVVKGIFEDAEKLKEDSQSITKLLYECTNHPKIKSGELSIVLFENIIFEDQKVSSLGIFKTEDRDTFLKIDHAGTGFEISHDQGLAMNKLDKACLIINAEVEKGYRILLLDGINKSMEAQYWKEEFLQIESCKDDYFNTKSFMKMTRNFVAEQLPEEYELERADQIELLNRSVNFFKENDVFEKEEFETEVLQHKEYIDSFNQFGQNFSEENELEIPDHFDIAPQAVKRQARVFKSILKLDKNFHVYIHGDRDKIEKGVDPDGRKFYKIYYENEQ